jgi:hypothetical protein
MKSGSKITFALSTIFLTSCFFRSPAPSNTQSDGFIIVGEQAVKLIGHCSNVYSEGVNEYWLPSNEDIQLLEQTLPTFLESFASQDISPQNYIRQYAGVIKNGRHIIFINGIHPGFAKSFAVGLDLSKEALVVCGGGNMIFGLEYYVEGNTFTNFMFNPPR